MTQTDFRPLPLSKHNLGAVLHNSYRPSRKLALNIQVKSGVFSAQLRDGCWKEASVVLDSTFLVSGV